MFKSIFFNSPFKVFYFVFAYIIVFSLWWGYLLYAKNETAFVETVELNEQRFRQQHPAADYKKTSEYGAVHSKYERQKMMILMEGTVFFLLLFAGGAVVRRVFKREIELAQLQRNFLLSITHELKSPLSTIKITLQTLLKRKLEPEKSEKLMNNSLVDLDRLESLVDNILVAAKIERNDPGFFDEDLDLSEIITHTAERFYMNKKLILIENEVPAGVCWRADRAGFTSVINNLLENAIKYSAPGSRVRITLQEEERSFTLSVADQGIGIPDQEKKKVFGKFYRVGNEDTRKTKGTGLGLYIVKRFVEIYAGTVTVADNRPSGTIVTLRFSKQE